MVALLAHGGDSGSEESLTLVAASSHTLLYGSIDSLFAVLGRDAQEFLLLFRSFSALLLFTLLGRVLFLGIAGALLAALVLAFNTDLV
jgi:hypothetical protein